MYPEENISLPQPIAAYILNRKLSPENVSTTSMYRYNPVEWISWEKKGEKIIINSQIIYDLLL